MEFFRKHQKAFIIVMGTCFLLWTFGSMLYMAVALMK